MFENRSGILLTRLEEVEGKLDKCLTLQVKLSTRVVKYQWMKANAGNIASATNCKGK